MGIWASADGKFLDVNGERLREQGCRLLYKPFDLEELLVLVREMVSARGS
jgi:hypothetical protein